MYMYIYTHTHFFDSSCTIRNKNKIVNNTAFLEFPKINYWF